MMKRLLLFILVVLLLAPPGKAYLQQWAGYESTEREAPGALSQEIIIKKAQTDVRNKQQETAFLGIQSHTLSREKARKLGFENPYGSYVSKVLGNTAAERAGIQPFDYIYGVDEYRTGEGQSLTDILRKFRVEDKATVHLVRKGKDLQVSVRFGSRSDVRRTFEDKCSEPFLGVQSTFSQYSEDGVPVNIVPNSTAAAIGLQNGDVITAINEYPMIDWEDMSAAVDNTRVGGEIRVQWLREGRNLSGNGTVKSYCETKTGQIAYAESQKQQEKRHLDLRQVEIQISDLGREEADELNKRTGTDLSSNNDLGIKQLELSPDTQFRTFRLSLVLPGRDRTQIRVFNSAGRAIYDYDLGVFGGNFSDEVDISQNGKGTYYLEVRQGKRTTIKKLVLK